MPSPSTSVSGRCTGADPEVVARVEPAPVGEGLGGGEQVGGRGLVAGGPGDLAGDLDAMRSVGGEVPLGADPVDVPRCRAGRAGGRRRGRRRSRRRPGSAYRTALVRTAGTPASPGHGEHARGVAEARRAVLAARGGRRPRRTPSPGGSATRQRSRTARARSGRAGQGGAAHLGVGAEQDGRARRRAGSPGRSACSPTQRRGSVDRPTARSPRRWVADTSRHSRPQPAAAGSSGARSAPSARTVTRGCRGSTLAPPRTGVRRAGQPSAVRGAGSAQAGTPASRPVGSTARSTPRIGAIPAAAAGQGELHRPVETVPVGERERRPCRAGGRPRRAPPASRRRSAGSTRRRRAGA